MPYQTLVDKLNSDCQFELDAEKLFSQVKYAMSRPANERDIALKNAVKFNFPEDCIDYQELRNKYNVNYRILGAMISNEDVEKGRRMYDIPKFYEAYLNIVTEMVKDIDPNHKVKPLFGITKEEAVEMQTEVLENASTNKEMLKFEMFVVRDSLDIYHEDIEYARADRHTKEVYQYSTASEAVKREIDHIYMIKKIVEEELKERGWWWRFRNRNGEAKKLRDIVKAAEKTLKDVKFPNEKKAEVKENYDKPQVHPGEKESIQRSTQTLYSAYEQKLEAARKQKEEKLEAERKQKEQELEAARKQKEAKLAEIDANREKDLAAAAEKDAISAMFDIRFRPSEDIDVFNSQIKIANQLSKVYLHNNKEIDPAAKKIFNANMEKIIMMKDHYKRFDSTGRNVSEEARQAHFDKVLEQFDEKERELAYTYQNYVPITAEDVDKAMTIKEPVPVDLGENTNANIEKSKPVDPEKSISKEKEAIGK